MLFRSSLEDQLPVFQALSSELRVKLLNLILENNGINIKQLSEMLSLSVSTISPHISRLEKCGLILLRDTPASHGTQKQCYPNVEQILIDFDPKHHRIPVYKVEIPVGQFTGFEVAPTCGLATKSSFLGKLDEPRYFAHPARLQAEILWFTTGYVEYVLPNFIPLGHQIDELKLSFEISSEAPRYNNCWPSDIVFSLNGVTLGQWTCPGDFGGRRGALNPEWWYDFLNQYGLLKTLIINTEGTFLDEEKLSDVTVRSLGLNAAAILRMRFSVSENAVNPGGVTLYGKGFGDHEQDLRLSITYSPEPQPETSDAGNEV